MNRPRINPQGFILELSDKAEAAGDNHASRAGHHVRHGHKGIINKRTMPGGVHGFIVGHVKLPILQTVNLQHSEPKHWVFVFYCMQK